MVRQGTDRSMYLWLCLPQRAQTMSSQGGWQGPRPGESVSSNLNTVADFIFQKWPQ